MAAAAACEPGVNQSRLVRRFIEICRADSAPLREGPVFRIVASALARLGLAVREDRTAEAAGGEVGNLIAALPGRGRLAAHAPILFSAHMDRASGGTGIRPVVKHGVIRSAGDTILGADDAAGLASVIEALHLLVESGSDRLPVEVVFTVGEEAGLVGARHLDLSALRSRCGFVVDAEEEVGTIICRSPGRVSIRVELTGRPELTRGSAGASDLGTSAVKMAAAAVSRMNLGRIDGETTANVSYVAGGPASTSANRAEIRAEASGLDERKLERQLAHMKRVLSEVAAQSGGKVEWSARRIYEGFSLDAGSEPVSRAKAAVALAGLRPELRSAGSGTDANVFNARGVPCAVLGAGFQGIHTRAERMPVAELVRLTRVVLHLMQGAGCA